MNKDYIDLYDHEKQLENPYHSTVAFERFLASHGCFRPGTRVMDIASGAGAIAYQFAKKNPNTNFHCVDYLEKVVEIGDRIIKKKEMKNMSIEWGDWFNLPKHFTGQFDGVFNVQSLCCFKKLNDALKPLVDLSPRWLGFNSLFYEGPLDVLIHIRDHNDPTLTDDIPNADFNTFSLPKMKEFLASHGYKKFIFEKFKMPADLPKPPGGARGTYTVQTEFDARAQFSGSVYLPWYFVLAAKE